MKHEHGHYVLFTSTRLLIFNSRLKRGRIILLNDGSAKDITYKSHPKIVKAILTKGEKVVSPMKFKRKGGT